MPVEISWLEPDKVLTFKFTGVITGDDLVETVTYSKGITEQYRGQLVHSLVDMRQMEKLPFTLQELRKVFSQLDPSVQLKGWVIMVGDMNPFLQFILSTLGQWFKFRFRNFHSLEAALTFLNQQDDSLPPLQAETPTSVVLQ